MGLYVVAGDTASPTRPSTTVTVTPSSTAPTAWTGNRSWCSKAGAVWRDCVGQRHPQLHAAQLR